MTENQNHPNQMTNSHILVQDFDYYEPISLDEVISLLNGVKGKVCLMAGGTHLMTMLKMERESLSAIVNIAGIHGLADISQNGQGELVIGAAATIHDIRHNDMVKRIYPALAEACAAFGSTQIQIMGTLGGNLCNGSPASDTVPPLMIYDARLVLKSASGERELRLDEFLLAPGKTALKAGEMLTAVILPEPPKDAASGFIKVSRVAADLAKASAAVLLVRDGAKIKQCRLAFGSVAPTVMRVKPAEEFLLNKQFSQELLAQAGAIVSENIAPIDDIRSTAWYRRRLSAAMTVDVLDVVWRRTDESGAKPLSVKGKPAVKIERSQPLHIAAGEKQEIELTVNGVRHRFLVSPGELLLNVLRDRMDLKGAKYGCGLGECGACTVLVDGLAMLSCLMLAASAHGRSIVTVEGLQKPTGELDSLQEIFIEESAFQCGFCTPGFLMATKSLLNEIPRPSEKDIRDYLKGNRCRCTGYASIMRAVIKSVQKTTE